MDLTSNLFWIFLIAAVFVYYLTPRDLRWMTLLAASALFFILSSPRSGLFLLLSVLITWFCAYRMETHPAQGKRYLAAGLLCSFGMLFTFKFSSFLTPFGISYYVFQSTGYLIDVYRRLIPAERNLAKYALFVSFFPQIAQGPIGRFDRLAPQLFAGNAFSYGNLRAGAERIVTGLCKKMVVADTARIFRTAVFGEYASGAGLSGVQITGVLFFTVELFANFSGGIDICIGVSRCFGITIDENFRRPFLAQTLQEFWQRWHITLGSWMKDYVFYPLARTRALSSLTMSLQKRFPQSRISRTLPQGVCSLVVFTLVGLWHGTSAGYLLYGLFNGAVICLSGIIAGAFRKRKTGASKNPGGFVRLLRMARTFAVVNLSWYFICADSASHALWMIRQSLTLPQLGQLLLIPAGRPGTGTAGTPLALTVVVGGTLLLALSGLLAERGRAEETRTERLPLFPRYVCFLLMLLAIPLFAPVGGEGGFIYAQF